MLRRLRHTLIFQFFGFCCWGGVGAGVGVWESTDVRGRPWTSVRSRRSGRTAEADEADEPICLPRYLPIKLNRR